MRSSLDFFQISFKNLFRCLINNTLLERILDPIFNCHVKKLMERMRRKIVTKSFREYMRVVLRNYHCYADDKTLKFLKFHLREENEARKARNLLRVYRKLVRA